MYSPLRIYFWWKEHAMHSPLRMWTKLVMYSHIHTSDLHKRVFNIYLVMFPTTRVLLSGRMSGNRCYSQSHLLRAGNIRQQSKSRLAVRVVVTSLALDKWRLASRFESYASNVCSHPRSRFEPSTNVMCSHDYTLHKSQKIQNGWCISDRFGNVISGNWPSAVVWKRDIFAMSLLIPLGFG